MMMKHLKPILALAVVVGVCSAFTFKSEGSSKSRVATLIYTYNLSTSTGAKNAANWTQVTGSIPSCGTSGDVPCKVSFDSSVYPTLQAYIDAQHFASDEEVVTGIGVVSKQ